jgi:3-hydroxy-9,10-secoandrosta-1,3,5(10)-triene-9,17-dione monooxygenase reductase component
MKVTSEIDPRYFRDVMGCYPTGVCVVTSTAENGDQFGMAVGSFTSISLAPPLVGFFPDKRSTSWPRIAATGRFCVNVLGSEQLALCERFASKIENKFEGIAHGRMADGLPLLDGAVAWIACTIEKEIELGDHLLVVGAVDKLRKQTDGPPLVFFQGAYHSLAV